MARARYAVRVRDGIPAVLSSFIARFGRRVSREQITDDPPHGDCTITPDDIGLIHIGYGTWADPAEYEALDCGGAGLPILVRVGPAPDFSSFHDRSNAR